MSKLLLIIMITLIPSIQIVGSDRTQNCDSIFIDVVAMYDFLKKSYPDDKWNNTINKYIALSDECGIEMVLHSEILSELISDDQYLLRDETLKIYILASYVFAIFHTGNIDQEDMVNFAFSEVILFYEAMEEFNTSIKSKSIEYYIRLKKNKKKWDKFINSEINKWENLSVGKTF